MQTKAQETIDFYVTGTEFIDGISHEAKEKIGLIYSDFSKELNQHSIETTFDGHIEERNYGRGADWIIAAVDFLATNPYVKALSTTAGLITLGKHIINFFSARKEAGLRLGIGAGRMFAIAKLAELCELSNIATLCQFEISKSETGFSNREYLYVFGVNKIDYDEQDIANDENYFKGQIYIVHLSWEGDIISINNY